jgi:hypothetical protein
MAIPCTLQHTATHITLINLKQKNKIFTKTQRYH